jgi:hypothetical protein
MYDMTKNHKIAFLVLIAISPVCSKFMVPVVAGPRLIERGLNYEVWTEDFERFTWVSARPWVWAGSEYVPYIFKDCYAEADYYLMRNGLITVRLYNDHAEFWDVNNTEVRVQEEKWLAQYYDKEWNTLDTFKPKFYVITNSSGIFITQSWSVGSPINSEDTFNVTYALRVGAPLKHVISLTNKGNLTREFRLVQAWDGIAATKVKCSESEVRVTTSTNLYSLRFQFASDTNDFVVFQDLQPTGYYDERYQYHNDVLQPTTFNISPEGMDAFFTYSNPNLYTLDPSENLGLDPLTTTFLAEYERTGYILRYGTVFPPGGESIVLGSSVWAGKEMEDEDPWPDHYWIWRGFVSFDTSSLDGKTVDDAELQMFLLCVICETKYGGEGVGFNLDFYSGKDQWTDDEDIDWLDCGTYEGTFLQVSPNQETRVYYNQTVDEDSINVDDSNGGLTQFRFNLYADTLVEPDYMTYIQKCAFDNPYDDEDQAPRLVVQYH